MGNRTRVLGHHAADQRNAEREESRGEEEEETTADTPTDPPYLLPPSTGGIKNQSVNITHAHPPTHAHTHTENTCTVCKIHSVNSMKINCVW